MKPITRGPTQQGQALGKRSRKALRIIAFERVCTCWHMDVLKLMFLDLNLNWQYCLRICKFLYHLIIIITRWDVYDDSGSSYLCHASEFSHIQLFATPWTIAGQAPLFLEFSRQKYWSGLPFPTPRNIPDPGIEPTSPALVGRFFTTVPPVFP